MKISVIIPVYNGKRYLARCIESVKAQTFKGWECIIVDDASTDGSIEELMRLTQNDKRFRILHYKKNAGTSISRNRGIKAAAGEALFFLDNDDWLDPVILEYLWNEHLANPGVGRIATPPINEWEETGRTSRWSVLPTGIHRPDSRALFSGPECDPGHVTGCLYVRKLIPAKAVEFPKMRVFEDQVFNMGLIMAGVTTLISGRYLYHYTRRPGATVRSPYTQEDAAQARESFDTLVKRWHPTEEVETRLRSFLERTIAYYTKKNGI